MRSIDPRALRHPAQSLAMATGAGPRRQTTWISLSVSDRPSASGAAIAARFAEMSVPMAGNMVRPAAVSTLCRASPSTSRRPLSRVGSFTTFFKRHKPKRLAIPQCFYPPCGFPQDTLDVGLRRANYRGIALQSFSRPGIQRPSRSLPPCDSLLNIANRLPSGASPTNQVAPLCGLRSCSYRTLGQFVVPDPLPR